MFINLIFFLSIAIMFLAVGFARQEERIVTVPISSSVRLKGATYHPHSEGVDMPISHAKALGFSENDFLGEQPEEDEDTGDSESEGNSEEEDSSGESETEESSEEEDEQEAESGDSEEETAEEAEAQPLPEDTPKHDALVKDERFATVEALLENADQLTDIDGIADKRAEEIVNHVKSKQG